MSLLQLMAAGSAAGSGGVTGNVGDAVDLDGTNDYFSRANDLVGNADGKTFTFSAWVYPNDTSNLNIIGADGGNAAFFRIAESVGGYRLNVGWYDSTQSFPSGFWNLITDNPIIPKNTFSHIYLSVDKNSQSYSLYINDSKITAFSLPYENLNDFDFTISSGYDIGAISGGSLNSGRISNVFLDYVFRNGDTEANRRLFTEFGDNGLQPTSTQASLNPILYMPFNDETQFFVNEGTGGNFTQNGTMARSSVGPSDYSAAASEFDGSADYMIKTGGIGGSDSKTATISFSIKPLDVSSTGLIYRALNSGNTTVYASIQITNNGVDIYELAFSLANSSGTQILSVKTQLFAKTNVFVSLSVDMSDTNKRHYLVNGIDVSPSWSIYTDDNIFWSGFDSNAVGANYNGTTPYDGVVSELYIEDSYIDLSENNPFYDIETNNPKYLGEQGELPTGSQPLVYLPMRADDAGDNRGSASDFTVISGPFVGARGPSEYLARSIVVDGTNYLTGSIFCQSLVKWVDTGGGWAVTYANAVTVTDIGNGTDNGEVAYYFGTSENINWGLEENTLRFTDAFGYPIAPVIDNNTVLFLDFTDSANFGLNKGSGADYTITGTPVSGADVTP